MSTNPLPIRNNPFTPDAYSEERKQSALLAKTPHEADAALRPRTGELWREASDAEKQGAVDYTYGSGTFNRPLRGYDSRGETDDTKMWDKSHFKGIGNVDLGAEGQDMGIKGLTGRDAERAKQD